MGCSWGFVLDNTPPRAYIQSVSLERVAIIPDLHAGDVDRRAVELACKIIEAFKPNRVIYLGDLLDSGWASHFPQNMGDLKGIFAREVAEWEWIASAFQSAAPEANFEAIPGNHDERIIRGYLWQQPALQDWRGLSWKEVLSLERFNIRWQYSPAAIKLAGGRFVVTHGSRVAKHSGGSAMLEMAERWWCSGVSGHTHRMAQVYRTTDSGVYCWTEAGHLQHRRPKYARVNEVAIPNWQQGIVLMHASTAEFRVPDLIPFWFKRGKLRARYGDREYES